MATMFYSSGKCDFERGDIWYIEAYKTEGSEEMAGRPAIIVSNDVGNNVSPVVEIVYLTTKEKQELPTHVEIRSAKYPSTAICEQVTTIAKTRIGKFISKCTPTEMMNIDIALAISLGLDLRKKCEAPKGEQAPTPQPTQKDNTEYKSDLVKVAAERDVYKSMYEQLLVKLMEQ